MTEEIKQKPGVGFGVMILRDNKVLLGKRHEDPEKASSLFHGEGTWTMPGGKLHFGESFEEGAAREVLEETGLVLKSSKVICVNNDVVEDAHFATVGLFSEDIEGEPKVMEPDEITEWRWFSLDSLPSPIFFPSAKVLESYKSHKASSIEEIQKRVMEYERKWASFKNVDFTPEEIKNLDTFDNVKQGALKAIEVVSSQ